MFFVYNTIGDIRHADTMMHNEKVEKIRDILSDKNVRQMFHRIRICELAVSWKLKVITLCYKYRIGISLLLKYLR